MYEYVTSNFDLFDGVAICQALVQCGTMDETLPVNFTFLLLNHAF